jgi:anti-anti-sigma factor
LSAFELERQEAEDGSVVHVHASGELDLTNAADIEERLAELAPGDPAVLVLDLNRVVFVDSAALHVLFRLARRLGRERLGLVVARTAPVARTLEIVGLERAAVTGETVAAVLAELERS